MFCSLCGKQLNDGAVFCPFCGGKVSQPETDAPSGAVVWEDATQKQKTKKPLRKWLVCAAAAAVTVLVGIGVLTGGISGFFARLTKSDAEYAQYLLQKDTDAVFRMLDAVGAGETADRKQTEQICLSLTGEGRDQIYRMYGRDVDLDWLKSVSLELFSDTSGDRSALGAELSLNNNKIVSGQAVLDNAEKQIYLSSDELLDDDILLDPVELYGSSFSWNSLIRIKNPLSAVLLPTLITGTVARYGAAAYATGSTVWSTAASILTAPEERELLQKYLNIAFENMNNVQKQPTVLSIGDRSQKCTEYRIIMDAATIANAVRAMVDSAKTDKALRTVLYESLQVTAERYKELGYDYDIDEALDAFYESLDDLKEDAEGLTESSFFDDTYRSRLSLYVTGNGQIIGRAFSCADPDEFSVSVRAVSVEKNFSFDLTAKECSFGDAYEVFRLTGGGIRTGSAVSGSLRFRVDGEDLLEIEIQNADLAKLRRGKLSGTYTLIPVGEELIYEIADLLDSYEDLAESLSLAVTLSGDTDDCAVSAALQRDGTALITGDFRLQKSKSKKIALPTRTVPVESVASDDLNLRRIYANLVGAGMPDWIAEELIDELD